MIPVSDKSRGRAQVYRRVWIGHAACQSPAGDAASSLAAVQAARHALSQDSQWGWMGRIPAYQSLEDLAFAAADPCWQQALADHGPASSVDQWPGIIASVSKGDTGAWLDRRANPLDWLQGGIPGQLSAALARRWNQRYYHGAAPVGACATGLLALLSAADAIESGQYAWGLAGAADRSLQDLLLGGFRSLGVCCGQNLPEVGAGTGFAPAEGAGFVSLSRRPLREDSWRLCAGLRLSDASHETRCEDPLVMPYLLAGLWEACPHPDIIVCHGTATKVGDAAEQAALNQGPWQTIPRLYCKPYIGHSLGANGMVELAIALQGPWRRIWKLSLGFAGHLAGIALQRNPADQDAVQGESTQEVQ